MTTYMFVKKYTFIFMFQLSFNLEHTNLSTMLGYKNIIPNYVDFLWDTSKLNTAGLDSYPHWRIDVDMFRIQNEKIVHPDNCIHWSN